MIAALAATLGSCEQPAATVPAVAVYFVEHERGDPPARTRMVITRDFVRIDDGRENSDFVLYDRAQRVIHNVNAADSSILVIGAHGVNRPPPLRLKHNIERDNVGAPDVGGKPVMHYRLRTNGQLCYELYAADDLLPEALAALREYREALAREHAAALAFTPRDLQTPCDLANNVYAPTRHLAHGFPIRIVETDGRTRGRERITELVDYDTEFEAGPALFRLPESYTRRTIQELRGR